MKRPSSPALRTWRASSKRRHSHSPSKRAKAASCSARSRPLTFTKLTEAGITIDRKRIHLHTPVKTLGKHEVKIKLHSDVTVEISFDVVSENPIEPVVQEAPASDRKEWKKPARKDSKE